MPYEISYSNNAAKELKKLDKSITTQIFKKIGELQENPDLGKPLSNVFKNYRSLHIGKFRVIYSKIEQNKEILIANVKHRKHAYDLW